MKSQPFQAVLLCRLLCFVFVSPSSLWGWLKQFAVRMVSVRGIWWSLRCCDWKMSLLKNYSNQGPLCPSPFVPAEFCQHSRSLGIPVTCSSTWESMFVFLGKFQKMRKLCCSEFLSLCNLGGWSYKERMARECWVEMLGGEYHPISCGLLDVALIVYCYNFCFVFILIITLCIYVHHSKLVYYAHVFRRL